MEETKEQTNKGRNKQANEGINEETNKQTKEETKEQTNEGRNKRTYEGRNKRRKKQTKEQTNKQINEGTKEGTKVNSIDISSSVLISLQCCCWLIKSCQDSMEIVAAAALQYSTCTRIEKARKYYLRRTILDKIIFVN